MRCFVKSSYGFDSAWIHDYLWDIEILEDILQKIFRGMGRIKSGFKLR